MEVLGQCEFELKLSEWSGMGVATVLELDTNFDIVLGLSWYRQWKPLPDWDTLDMFVNSPQGVLRITHKMGAVDAVVHRLTVIEDLPEELRSSHISLKEAEKELKGGIKVYLYFIREHTGDPDEDATPRGDSDENSGSSVDANMHSEGCHIVNSGVANVVDSGPLAQRHVVNSGSNQANVVDSSLRRDSVVNPMSKVVKAKTKLKRLLKEYKDIFREELPDGLPPKRAVDHVIDTGDHSPVNKNAYPLSVQQLQEQVQQIEELLKRGLIRESISPWGAPVLFILKKTGE